MNKKKQISLLFLSLTLLFSGVVSAKTSEEEVKEQVNKEVSRLLNSEEFMAPLIEKGIENFIKKQERLAQEQKDAIQQQRAKNIRPVDLKTDHVRGNPDAPITLIEYSDFECPFCKRFHPTVMKLLENNPQKIRWVYRHFPLDFHEPGASKQAEASECVADIAGNDAFWKYTDLIYKRTKSNGKGFPIAKLQGLAEEIGVDGKAFKQCYDTGKFAEKVRKDIANGKKIGVTGTPAAFLLNKKGDMRFIGGALPLERIQSLVDQINK